VTPTWGRLHNCRVGACSRVVAKRGRPLAFSCINELRRESIRNSANPSVVLPQQRDDEVTGRWSKPLCWVRWQP